MLQKVTRDGSSEGGWFRGSAGFPRLCAEAAPSSPAASGRAEQTPIILVPPSTSRTIAHPLGVIPELALRVPWINKDSSCQKRPPCYGKDSALCPPRSATRLDAQRTGRRSPAGPGPGSFPPTTPAWGAVVSHERLGGGVLCVCRGGVSAQ